MDKTKVLTEKFPKSCFNCLYVSIWTSGRDCLHPLDRGWTCKLDLCDKIQNYLEKESVLDNQNNKTFACEIANICDSFELNEWQIYDEWGIDEFSFKKNIF